MGLKQASNQKKQTQGPQQGASAFGTQGPSRGGFGGAAGGAGATSTWGNRGAAGAVGAAARTLGTSFGSVSQPASKQPSVPICSVGFKFDSRAAPVREISSTPTPGQEAISVPFIVNYIGAIDVFENYTLEEIRYFDYLYTGVCLPPTKESASAQGLGSGLAGQNQAADRPEAKVRTATPWKWPAEKTPAIATSQQEAPFGVIPPTKLQLETGEGNDADENIVVTPDRGFYDDEEEITPVAVSSGQPQRSSAPTAANIDLEALWKGTAFSDDEDDLMEEQMETLTIPELETLETHDKVENFTIVTANGIITFPCSFAPRAIDIRSAITFSPGRIDIDLPRGIQQEAGMKNAFPTFVRLKNMWPERNQENSSNPDMLREYADQLDKWCKNHGLELVDYNSKDGMMSFTVPLLSKYPIEPPY